MVILKALFKKLKPESPKVQAVLLTTVILIVFTVAIGFLVAYPVEVIALAILVGVIVFMGFCAYSVYREVLKALERHIK